MRRGGGGSNNYGIGSNTNPNMPAPFISDHLRDLDKELELLQMKREMIEQQQQLLNQQMGYSNQRQQSSSIYGSHVFEDQSKYEYDYSHLYDDNRTSDDFIPVSDRGRKRASTTQWNDDFSSAKRFSGPTRGAPNKRTNPYRAAAPSGSGQQRYYDKPKSLLDIKSGFPSKKKPFPVAVAKQAPVPAFKPPAASSVSQLRPVKPVEKLLFRPDCEPSRALNGRLELALGNILKDLKEKYSDVKPYVLNFRLPHLLKCMKIEIRKRIRQTMLGKEVGTPLDILVEYRKKFSKESDKEILNLCLNEHTDLDFKRHVLTTLLSKDDPEVHFQENVSKMIEYKLQKMFVKLSEIYTKNHKPRTDIIQLTVVEDSDDKPVTAEGNNKGDTQINNDSTNDDVIEIKDNSTIEVKDDEQKKAKFTKKDFNLDKLIEVKLPGILRKNIKHIISLLDFPSMYKIFKMDYVGKVGFGNQQTAPAQNNDVPMDMSDSLNTSASANKTYYVKVTGHPYLPKKVVMQTFLKQFEPKSIKKHRKIANLLFIGFSDLQSVEKIVAADGTMISKLTLSIKYDQNYQPGPNSGPAEKSVEVEKAKKDVIVIEDDIPVADGKNDPETVLCETIDKEITSLLQSIREAEENTSNESTEEGESKIFDNAVPGAKTEQASENNLEIKSKQESTGNTTTNVSDADKIDKTDLSESLKNNELEPIKEVDENADEEMNKENDANADAEMDKKDDANMEANKKDGENIDEEMKKNDDANVEANKTDTQNSNVEMSKGDDKDESGVTEKDNEDVDKEKGKGPAKVGQGTPAKGGTRVATPMTVRTRRASRLQNNQ